MDFLNKLRVNMGIPTAEQSETKTLPDGAVPVLDENNQVYAYTIGNSMYSLDGALLGGLSDVQAALKTPVEQEVVARNAFAQPIIAVESTQLSSPSMQVVPKDDEAAIILAQAMDAVDKTIIVSNNKQVNIPLTLDFGVVNKGIFSSQKFSEDTLPKFRMDLNALTNRLLSVDWPEYVTNPAIEFQFNSSGALTTPASGFTRAAVVPANFSTIGYPLAYKVVCSVVDTLIGNSLLQFFGTENAYRRTYRFDKTTTGFIVMPRSAGNVNDYTIGAGSTVVFDGVDASNRAVTGSAAESPSVPDDFDPVASIVAIGGSNINIQITPYIPTRMEANNLVNLIRLGADAEVVANTIAALANISR